MTEKRFASLDRQAECRAESCEPEEFTALQRFTQSRRLIGRGGGVCFVASSFGEGIRSVDMRRFDRVIDFQPQQRRITVEAGISLGKLYSFLAPHRLYLSIQPGHPQISIGGCIACNVHGKNPARDGLFRDIVESICLFHPRHGLMTVSRENLPDVFDLTCGGFGLTGLILSATLRLAEASSLSVRIQKVMVRNLEETCEQIGALSDQHDFLYSWNDLSAFDRSLGRGFAVVGNFVEQDEAPVPSEWSRYSLDPSDSNRWRPKLFQSWSVPWFARAYLWFQQAGPSTSVIDLCRFQFPKPWIVGRIDRYFDWYGKTGFLAHMVLIPDDGWRSYVRKFEAITKSSRVPVLVSSIKRFDGQQRALDFNGRGFSLHLHVPKTASGVTHVQRLDNLAHDFGAPRAIYVDSRLIPSSAERLYPGYVSFKQRLWSYDPERMLESTLSRRLEL